MLFYVPVGPRGILFRFGMSWTRVLGGWSYWSAQRRGRKSLSTHVYPMRPLATKPPLVPRAEAAMNSKIGWRAVGGETEAEPVRDILPFDGTLFSQGRAMSHGGPDLDEVLRIRELCVELGGDAEVTELVLASRQYDLGLEDAKPAIGATLPEYVGSKLAVWEAILNDSREPGLQNGPRAVIDHETR